MKILHTLLLLAGLATNAVAGEYYGIKINTNAGTADLHISGKFCVRVSSTNAECKATIDGATGNILTSGTVDGYNISGQFELVAGTTDTFKARLDDLDLSTAALSISTAALSLSTASNASRLDEVAVSTTAIAVSTTTLGLTPNGMRVEDEGNILPSVSTINFVGPGVEAVQSGDKITVTISTEATGDIFRSTGTILNTVSSGSVQWSSVDGSTLTLVMEGTQFVDIMLSCNIECLDFVQCGVSFGYLDNGAFGSGITASTTTGIMYLKTGAMVPGAPEPLNFLHTTQAKLSPGTHEISLIWATDDGVAVQMGRDMTCTIGYAESPETLGGGGTSVVSNQTNFGSQDQTAIQTALTCDVLPCVAQGNFGNYCVWVATPPAGAVGGWMNQCSGLGPYD